MTPNKKNKSKLEGGGRLPSTLGIEENLIKWISEHRRLGIGLTTQEIINKSCELEQKQKDKSPSSLEHWCLAFLRRYSYSFRATTHVRQKLKECELAYFKEFMNYAYSLKGIRKRKYISCYL